MVYVVDVVVDVVAGGVGVVVICLCVCSWFERARVCIVVCVLVCV